MHACIDIHIQLLCRIFGHSQILAGSSKHSSEFSDIAVEQILFVSCRILVLANGTVKEFDSPQALIADKSTVFYSMVKDAGLIQE